MIHIGWTDEHGERHQKTLTMQPVPERHAAIMRRRGMTVPEMASDFPRGALIPYRWRGRHRRYAYLHGYFWLPCPLCNRPFGGHEIGDSIPDPTRPPNGGVMICPACTAERNGARV